MNWRILFFKLLSLVSRNVTPRSTTLPQYLLVIIAMAWGVGGASSSSSGMGRPIFSHFGSRCRRRWTRARIAPSVGRLTGLILIASWAAGTCSSSGRSSRLQGMKGSAIGSVLLQEAPPDLVDAADAVLELLLMREHLAAELHIVQVQLLHQVEQILALPVVVIALRVQGLAER